MGGTIRIAYTSDLHVDICENNLRAAQIVAEALIDLKPDMFVFAGDVSPHLKDVENVFLAFEKITVPKLFVCGNHDIWVSKNKQYEGYNSHTKYRRDLKEVCERHGVVYLPKQPIVISDTAFVGTMGWYDYSFRNEAFDHILSVSNYKAKCAAYVIWNDGEYAYWAIDPDVAGKDWTIRRNLARMSDVDVSKMLCRELENQIRRVEREAKRIIAVTHMVPFKQLVYYKQDPQSDFVTAFIGSVELGKVITTSKLVTHVIYGHTHQPQSTSIGSVACLCSPIGYLNQQFLSPKEFREFVSSRVKIFEIA